eukprot:CAMPEP_0203938222 /NCGR_PEP_ID=MMETSP0359-20131031/75306_1 /ASSEMBLY_ACC=CAM_ASM_000338 /TAXON_ID=268821 /ORGANISM="Scrippsiella Hangoei, Strain SHTV-5" /LENGTH=74 /DNA_ID=CAMNT_0050868405 /DNA_START=24 /DNA_END=245 /DNA_ORIENTATION=-
MALIPMLLCMTCLPMPACPLKSSSSNTASGLAIGSVRRNTYDMDAVRNQWWSAPRPQHHCNMAAEPRFVSVADE